MGFYERILFPWLCDKMASGPEAERRRAQVLTPARGRVEQFEWPGAPKFASFTTIGCAVPN